MKMTSAYANKILKKLQDEKGVLLDRERTLSTYTVASDETHPIVPDFNFPANLKAIADIDNEIVIIKHAINRTNTENTIEVDGEQMTIDAALIKLAQLSARKNVLDTLRKHQPVARVDRGYAARNVTEYMYANYVINDAKAEYDRVSNLIASIQLALDNYNQTVMFDVDINL